MHHLAVWTPNVGLGLADEGRKGLPATQTNANELEFAGIRLLFHILVGHILLALFHDGEPIIQICQTCLADFGGVGAIKGQPPPRVRRGGGGGGGGAVVGLRILAGAVVRLHIRLPAKFLLRLLDFPFFLLDGFGSWGWSWFLFPLVQIFRTIANRAVQRIVQFGLELLALVIAITTVIQTSPVILSRCPVLRSFLPFRKGYLFQ